MNDVVVPTHWRRLMRVIKFALNTKEKILRFDILDRKMKDKVWTLKAFCDGNWEGCSDYRKDITGYCIYFMGCLVAWNSRGQKNVTLSSSEAEYVVLSEVYCEIMFMRMILEFMGVKVKKPITVNCDTFRTVFLANNVKMGARSKHIDIKYHFVQEFMIDSTVEKEFGRSKDNDSYIFTKNVSKET
uniref:Reverse transcriptase Ty1/copia-type domain-containing protein n=1 Tax=Eucampia antarctica TaxID=49252 RepID=A0A7S2RXH7_9STRA|mmetsp:Transcript_28209/g.27038  ORF Transcript_28209/g.27038 Transcript_28209/m.27038 type:complete len:186 (+) Transcript_28209:217-774(+)